MRRTAYFKQALLDFCFVDLRFPESVAQSDLLYVHLGLRSLTSYLRSKGYTAEVIYYHKNIPSREKSFLSFYSNEISLRKPIFLGFSPYAPINGEKHNDLFLIEGIVKMLRRRNLLPYVILGGHWATFNHDKLLKDFPWIDFIVRGEGEITLDELINAIKNKGDLKKIRGLSFRDGAKIIHNQVRPLIKNLDSLPIPALDNLDEAKRLGIVIDCIPIISSRGCYGCCSFCSVQSFYRLSPKEKTYWRARSAMNIVNEIETLSKRYNCYNFHFVDDNFIGPAPLGRERAKAFATEVIRRGLKINFFLACRPDDVDYQTFKLLKKAGLRAVQIGVESGSNRGLMIFNKCLKVWHNMRAIKILNSLKIRTDPFLIFMHPYSNLKEIEENIKFCRYMLNLRYVFWDKILFFENYLTVRDGTLIKHSVEKDGLLHGDYINGYNYSFKNNKMNFIRKICEELSNVFYSSFDPGDYSIRLYRNKLTSFFIIKVFEKALKIVKKNSNRLDSQKSFIKKIKSELRLFLHKINNYLLKASIK